MPVFKNACIKRKQIKNKCNVLKCITEVGAQKWRTIRESMFWSLKIDSPLQHARLMFDFPQIKIYEILPEMHSVKSQGIAWAELLKAGHPCITGMLILRIITKIKCYNDYKVLSMVLGAKKCSRNVSLAIVLIALLLSLGKHSTLGVSNRKNLEEVICELYLEHEYVVIL